MMSSRLLDFFTNVVSVRHGASLPGSAEKPTQHLHFRWGFTSLVYIHYGESQINHSEIRTTTTDPIDVTRMP